MRTKNLLPVLGIMLFWLLCGCAPSMNQVKETDQLQVYTTLYPLEYFTKRIGGERVQVENLVPVGIDLHDFEPSAKELAKLTNADVLIYNGAGLEPWIEKIGSTIDPQRTKMIQTTVSIQLISAGEEQDHDHQHKQNPHVWLDPQLAKKQADTIKRGLIQVDPQHRALYERNYQQLAKELDQLDRELQLVMEQRKVDTIVLPHDAFVYLTKRFGLKQITISGLSPMDEPSPQRLKQVVDAIRKHHLKAIFVEPFGSGKLVKAIQRETGVKVLSLHPLEGRTKQDVLRRENYFSIMRKNIEHLEIALKNGEE